MKRILVLLAVTKMRSGFCLAGADPATGDWVRPVKDFGSLQGGDLLYRDRTSLCAFDCAEFSLGKSRPRSPHVEDWTCDFVRERPVKQTKLTGDERTAFLERWAEPDVSPVVLHHSRSLILTPIEDFTATFTLDSVTRKLEARIASPLFGVTTSVPVTDLRWRALGRQRYGATGGLPLALSHLSTDLGVERFYLALGLSREYEGRIWPLVIGIHCVPDYEVSIDYKNP